MKNESRLSAQPLDTFNDWYLIIRHFWCGNRLQPRSKVCSY